MQRIALSVIGGFLGAGKTTLLNHWLGHAQGQRLALLVNDFGAINIDAEQIQSQDSTTIALTNGCVCCQISGDLSAALLKVTATEPPFDAIVVEASGVSNPKQIAQIGQADPFLSLEAIVVVVDAAELSQHAQDPLLSDTLQTQVRAASVVVLNKTDLSQDHELRFAHAWIEKHAPGVPVIPASYGRVPSVLVGGLAMNRSSALWTQGRMQRQEAHATLFEQFSCTPQRVFDWQALRQWIKAPPPGLLRLKGRLLVNKTSGSNPCWMEIQTAGRYGSLHRSEARSDGAVVVAIGLRGALPVQALNDLFGAEVANP
jgi:G3E family GTPase